MAIKIIKRNSKDYKKYPYAINSDEWSHILLVTKQELISLHTKIGKMLKIKSYQDFVDEVDEDKAKFLGGFNYKGKK